VFVGVFVGVFVRVLEGGSVVGFAVLLLGGDIGESGDAKGFCVAEAEDKMMGIEVDAVTGGGVVSIGGGKGVDYEVGDDGDSGEEDVAATRVEIAFAIIYGRELLDLCLCKLGL